jgi:hypothetical protein
MDEKHAKQSEDAIVRLRVIRWLYRVLNLASIVLVISGWVAPLFLLLGLGLIVVLAVVRVWLLPRLLCPACRQPFFLPYGYPWGLLADGSAATACGHCGQPCGATRLFGPSDYKMPDWLAYTTLAILIGGLVIFAAYLEWKSG